MKLDITANNSFNQDGELTQRKWTPKPVISTFPILKAKVMLSAMYLRPHKAFDIK